MDRLHKSITAFLDGIKSNYFYMYLQQNRILFLANIIVLVIFIFLFVVGVFDVSAFVSAFFPILINFPFIAWNNNNMSDKMKIMGLSIDYMLNQGGVTLDDVMGILISNKLKKRIVDPTRNFFETIEKLCINGNPEQRRRVAESLPALYRLNKKGTKDIIEKKLRNDFDDAEWHDDNRRRTVEALLYLPKKENDFVKKIIRLRLHDSIYTIIAIVEIISMTKKFKIDEKTELLNRLKKEVKTFQLGQCVLDFIQEAETFLGDLTLKEKDVLIRCNFMREIFKHSKSNYMKILISKNILYICPNRKKCLKMDECQDPVTCASCIFELFDLCFDSINHENIRRPMAKEDVCFCLLSMLEHTACRNEARRRIISLIKEQDMIIAITVFDYIHKIYELDKPLYNEILSYCLDLPSEGKYTLLKERAEHVSKTVGIA